MIWISGTDQSEKMIGTPESESIDARDGNDTVYAGAGDDIVIGSGGSDLLFGQEGDDTLFSDSTVNVPRDKVVAGNDVLDGGPGDDYLVAGDGHDLMTGGAGKDRFLFRYHDPKTEGSVQPVQIADFDARQDKFVFDAKDLLGSMSADGNFVNHSTGGLGGAADTFFQGRAADANGEHVLVLTDQSFGDSSEAAASVNNEKPGDIIVYNDDQYGSVILAYVDSEDHAHPFAQLSNVEDTSEQFFSRDNFIFT
ncbi:calcium-binding protein [Sinorhizobium saheli]|uniref:Calcium-binding protein n=1 Tax=Sinorhizobium saheli TaxID=36856 RepID=A0A178XYT3_SINSA|nr:calcium-binding protein [Sinorhizobium saheli]MQW86401.1 calcium-binding protein [Sinorhizobium saheli]OAP39635.1 hypothetical protein ATB98_04750 [Sinorhizobium saheli]